jgi:hypothetical protein
MGMVLLHLSEDDGVKDIKLSEVYYVPSIWDLISVGKLALKGLTIRMSSCEANVIKEGRIVLRAPKKRNSYVVRAEGSPANFEKEACNKAARVSLSTWHDRLGHLHKEALMKIPHIKANMEEEALSSCSTCTQGKLRRKPFPQGINNKVSNPLYCIHSDVVGKISPPSIGGAEYIVTFKDIYSNYVTAIPIKKKSQVFVEFCTYQERVENINGRKIKEFHSDNGGEYCNKEFEARFNEKGILHRRSVPYTPQQN